LKIAEVTGSDTATKNCSDTNLDFGFTYDYRLRAVKGTNSSIYIMSTGYINDFKAPTSLTATQTNLITATLTWPDSYTGEDKFEIEKKLNTESNYFKIGEIIGSDTSTKSFTDSLIEPDLTYDYRIRIVDGINYSEYTYTTHFNQFNPPILLSSIILNDTSLKINWSDNSLWEDGFIIDRKIGIDGLWINGYDSVVSNVCSYKDENLQSNTTYYYKIRAKYSVYYSNSSNELYSTPTTFILVPAGSFEMGSMPYFQPVHTVNITRTFYIGRSEITQTKWIEVMGSNPSWYTSSLENPVEKVKWYATLIYCNKRSIKENLSPCYTINGTTDPTLWGSIPSTYNSLWDAVTCNFDAKGYRLPTEAEWEYVARFNDSRIYPWGDAAPDSTLCNFEGTNLDSTTPVGSFPFGNSQLGLCDLAGNAREWVWDRYGAYTDTTQTDPTGSTTGEYRILRGGRFFDSSYYLECTRRIYEYPHYESYNASGLNGFRVVRKE
jgi:formylglycine-generating enzyme required for sulfatase activity